MNLSAHAKQSSDLFRKQLISRISSFFCQYKQSDVVIWGTGEFGQKVAKFLVEHLNLKQHIKCFCDSFHDDSVFKEVESIPVFSPIKATAEYPQAVYIIASDFYEEILSSIAKSDYHFIKTTVVDDECKMHITQLSYYTMPPDNNKVAGFNHTWFDIYSDLKQSGRLDKYIGEIYPMLEDNESRQILDNRFNTFLSGDMSFIDKNPINTTEYFSNEFYSIGSSEVLFDCGAYDGDTINAFNSFTLGNYLKVLAFEPDEKNLKKLHALVEDNSFHDIEVVSAATGSKNGEVCFNATGNLAARIIPGDAKRLSFGEDIVKLVKLDNYIDYKPTLIKMDIEGAELDSLKGASEIIRKYKPKLAICIYHLPLDFYDIPVFLKSLVPEYHFKVRQHGKGFSETILYAYVE
ncbi:MAG: FkbM family methyltransferase [Succinivibrio sp.]